MGLSKVHVSALFDIDNEQVRHIQSRCAAIDSLAVKKQVRGVCALGGGGVLLWQGHRHGP